MVKCNDLTYALVNALTVRVGGGTKALTAHKVDGVIHSIEGEGSICFTLGLTIEVKKQKYKINLIEEKWINNILVFEVSIAKRTKSFTYILPMLGPGKELFMIDRLVNVFTSTQNNKNCIAILYRYSGDPLFLKLEQAFKKFSYFREIEDVDPYHVLFVFNVPDKYKSVYRNFIKGKYSKFNKLYKLHILDFFNLTKDSQVCQVLFKSPARRLVLDKLLGTELPENSELLSIIDEKETYNPDIYKPKKLL
jgi:hypothetical protein|tara:strand:- start:1255 stop:2004 length:750 start_codon:yes stop_codon:yes gene_type:complete